MMCQQSLANVLAVRGSAVVQVNEDGLPSPPASLEAALQTMFAAADVVFAGQVTRVTHSEGFVDVRFRVDEAVRGVAADTYTLREWSGLWTDHARYVVGQRLLLLLHSPSAAGFASPVGGMDGAIPLSGDDASGSVDLRWVNAHVARKHTQSAAMAVAAGPVADGGAAASTTTDAVSKTDRGMVMDLLHAWQRRDAAAR